MSMISTLPYLTFPYQPYVCHRTAHTPTTLSTAKQDQGNPNQTKPTLPSPLHVQIQYQHTTSTPEPTYLTYLSYQNTTIAEMTHTVIETKEEKKKLVEEPPYLLQGHVQVISHRFAFKLFGITRKPVWFQISVWPTP